ncbi:hypothetical protein LWI29_013596 [Acer saccharum]|uniref:Uncharacterized protein n=1 Tax=Acer saccharum TaxID=4024 RepID=A0AA39VB83_ACESA|nr:hypothetical protein LWI29_013596 [Acer saccharum]
MIEPIQYRILAPNSSSFDHFREAKNRAKVEVRKTVPVGVASNQGNWPQSLYSVASRAAKISIFQGDQPWRLSSLATTIATNFQGVWQLSMATNQVATTSRLNFEPNFQCVWRLSMSTNHFASTTRLTANQG